MYEQSLLCGIMNDWYGSMEDLFQDLKHYGFEVLESNRESITVSCDDDGDTNKALAVFLGMTASNFSTIWNGRQPFQRKHIVRIAVRYQLSPQDVWDIFFLADAEAIKKEAREA